MAEVQRRLAAILAADVVGFSAMMERAEEATYAEINRLRREVIDPNLARHQGRLIKSTGDGVLAEFASPLAAAKCAIDIQRTLSTSPDGIRMRIGLNLGDVIVQEDGDVYGEGINVAARLEGLADPGGILVSAKVHNEIEGKLDAEFEDRGERQLKNIAKPIRTYAVTPSGNDSNEDAEQHSENKWHDHKASRITKAIAALVVYGLFISLDISELWPWSHGFAMFAGILATIALLYMEAFATEAISFPSFLICSAVILISGLLILIFVPQGPAPFKIVGSLPFWGRHFEKTKLGPDISGFAIQRGAFRAASTLDGARGSINVDLLVHVAITNVSDSPRRIAEYKLSVAPSKSGPWTALCPINFRFTSLFWAAEPQHPIKWAEDDMLDNKLSANAMGPGDTLSGWIGLICPAGSSDECRPTFLKYTVYDSRGEQIEHVVSNERSARAIELHDWAAESYLKNKQPIDRDFSKEPLIEGVCP